MARRPESQSKGYHPLEAYLKELRDIRLSGGGVKETSYYGPLAALLNEAGRGFRPKVRCIVNLRDTGAGIPDGGFFTESQLPKASAEAPEEGQIPERGALEVKGIDEDIFRIAETEQVEKYLNRYGQVLVTNLRDFVLVGADHTGRRRALESFRIAPNQSAFLDALKHPRRTAKERGEPLFEYLKRVLLHPAPLADPKDLAWFLASYAKDARKRVETAGVPSLAALRESLEGSLGIEFKGERGEHFFQSTLVQTLFYGVFSAWVLWSRGGGEGRFHWKEAAWHLRVPMIRALFHQVADPDRLHRLDLVEVLDWTAEALNRVDRAAFFTRFREEHAVQYFYEPFLEAFDPELRRQLGVWYTPPEVVRYMVAKVDHALRTELDIPDGLADERVVVLDPCCGTGAYLVEVLHRIEGTLRERGDDALVASDVKRAARERVFGFEIMPAPFVVAHLQLGLVLQQMEVPFTPEERAGVYLTNALTGWVPPKDPKDQIPISLPELQTEREQAAHVKRDAPILVILGNPPYSGYAGLAMGEERDLVDAYRSTKKAPKPRGQGLNDLYVRFFRMAERKITEMQPHRGVVCFISNYSWLDRASYSGMRERFIERFDRIWIDNLHGDRIISEYAPDGRTSETIFAMEGSSVGIKIGTAISTLAVTGGEEEGDAVVFYRDFDQARASERRAALLQSLRDGDAGYAALIPVAEIGLPLKPKTVAEAYFGWPKLPDLFPSSFPGVGTSRDTFLVDVDEVRLRRRIDEYFDPSVSDLELEASYPAIMASKKDYDAGQVRRYLLSRGATKGRIIRYLYRPLDLRWLYWEPETRLLHRESPDYIPHIDPDNIWITSRQRGRRREFYQPQVTCLAADYNVVEASTSIFPIFLVGQGGGDLFDQPTDDDPRRIDGERRFNLSDLAVEYLEEIGSVQEDAPHLFHHAIAVMHAPAYREENAGALRQDWPRIPLPETREQLLAFAELGRRLAALLNPETPVPGVTMPGRGRAELRDYTDEEREALARGAEGLGMSPEEVTELVGDRCYDVYLNDRAYWRCIPTRVWDYTLGGYQVIKKWLSYREEGLLGRPLKPDEAREVTNIARRISAILLMEGELDGGYREVVADAAAAKPAEARS